MKGGTTKREMAGGCHDNIWAGKRASYRGNQSEQQRSEWASKKCFAESGWYCKVGDLSD